MEIFALLRTLPDLRTAGPMFPEMLVPVLFSAQCELATCYAAAFTCRLNSELILLLVVAPTIATGLATDLNKPEAERSCPVPRLVTHTLR
jgi:hypothetical protein